MASMTRQGVSMVLGPILLVAGLVGGFIITPPVLTQWDTQGYPPVEATVLSKTGSGFTYQFPVGRKIYEGQTVRKAGVLGPLAAEKERLNALKKGDKLTIYYRPDDPKQSLVFSGLRPIDHAAPIFCLGLIFLGLGNLIWGVTALRNLNRLPETGGIPYYSQGVETGVQGYPAAPVSKFLGVSGLGCILYAGLGLATSSASVLSPVFWACAVLPAATIFGLEFRAGETFEVLLDPATGKLSVPEIPEGASPHGAVLRGWLIGLERRDITFASIDNIGKVCLLAPGSELFGMWSVAISYHCGEENPRSLFGIATSKDQCERLLSWIKSRIKFQQEPSKAKSAKAGAH